MNTEAVKANLATWEAWTDSHFDGGLYDIDSFRAGRNTLNPLEIQEVGDVTGKSLLHLQCHFGLDTLSWERMGAKTTGVDFSTKAITKAQGLASELDLSSRFICSSIYDLKDNLEGQFDIVFTSYGVLTWLPDLQPWAETITHFLKPGGLFYIAEFHPTMCMFDNRPGVQDWRLGWPYFNSGKPMIEVNTGSYANPESGIQTASHEFPHPLSEVVQSLIDAGLKLQTFREHDFSCWQFNELLSKSEDGYWRTADPEANIPLMYSISARK